MISLGNLRRTGEVSFSSEDSTARPLLEPSAGDPTTGAKRLRVMIVEDELFVAMHLESVLEEIGYEVTGLYANGETAVAEFRRHEPDLVLMDINLGVGIDGVAAAQRIRASGDVPIIFVSAYSDAATRSRVEAALPGSRILSKPVTPGGLKDAIELQVRTRQ